MTDIQTPFGNIDQAVLQVIVDHDATVAANMDRIGGDYNFTPETGMPWYIEITKIPGGRANRFEGTFVIDIDVYGSDYLEAESVAYAVEATLLGYPHVVEVEDRKVIFDSVFQNVGVAELPWDDDGVYRLGATYVITARRR